MGIASTGVTRAILALLIGCAAPLASPGAAAAADFAIRVKNDTRGVVRARVQAIQQDQQQSNAWTEWSEALPYEGSKSYRFTGAAPTFYVEMQYDDGIEWRHVCTKIVAPTRGFTLTTLGAVPHMRCGIGAGEPAKTVAVARHRPAQVARQRAARPAVARQPVAATPVQTAALPDAPAAAHPQPAQASVAAPRRQVIRPVRTQQQVRRTPPAADATRAAAVQRLPDARESWRSYSREEGCLDDRAFMERDRPWCHIGHGVFAHR